ncbi:MAG TPA: NYN domain-containing protein [Thermoanaerobaculia bacterium]|nr:NYN domain-containing protein [Thermoanaerobaculia bacterium]
MPYFLDGNNLIGRARGTARPSEKDRKEFLAEIADRLRATRAKATVFFDGAGERSSTLGSLTIRESGSEPADDLIIREIGRFREPREVIVVTADRGLARRARDAGAGAITPDEFWSRFGRGEHRQPGKDAPKVDVDDWLRYFGDEKNRDS